ncbi:MAG: DUF2520 domain-containing protein [Nitriliruptoraceae bacterium]|nr:DUF2520 domain-containing protein [Nitriliruptoraceae bacterium]
MTRTRVTIVGPGRGGALLATSAARARGAGVAGAGGPAAARDRLRGLVAGVRDLPLAEAVGLADLVLLAVPDDAIVPTVRSLAREDVWRAGQRLVHVAGSHGLEPLELARRAGVGTAACHPAMTVPADTTDPDHLLGVRWAVTAGSADLAWAREVVEALGGDPVEVAPDRRVLYHAALTVGSNAVAAATASARALLHAAGVQDPGALLAPLAHASVEVAVAQGAGGVTGPIVRGDHGTLARHLQALDVDVPDLAARYRALQQVVLATVAPGLAPQVHDELAALLDAAPATSPTSPTPSAPGAAAPPAPSPSTTAPGRA